MRHYASIYWDKHPFIKNRLCLHLLGQLLTVSIQHKQPFLVRKDFKKRELMREGDRKVCKGRVCGRQD